ncbi:hypothetical protein [Polynucleobacter sphagniphilus]|uniref:Uncharacterized protein n=1 Tax=Polynucleobacter sphagniphilus TaxID=1743169 RepID=A0AA43M9B3_9BURK|nr:hypothetical protein [Polynucleobacter sphagniphilus]MDH6504065.1 hypothetical protein [Polynucleobacter sphagniphilus]MDH6512557.1 hypothetical protein [Polynucleobacter sphagniphilus]
MARFNNETRKKRIKELMRMLEKGLDVSPRDFNNAVEKDFAKLYKQRWAEQQELREIKPPQQVKEYEQMLQEAVMWHGRLDSYSGRNPKVGKVIVNRKQVMDDMKNKTDGLFERAYEKLQEIIATDKTLVMWFDRGIDFSFDSDISLDSDGMPRLITSKSANNLAQGRLQQLHGWKTKAQVKLDVMALALEELVKQERTAEEIEAELKQNQQQAEKLKGMLAKLKKQGE